MKKIYSILDLLQKQPKILKNTENYVSLMRLYSESPVLKKIRLKYSIFTKLNNVKISPDNLFLLYKELSIARNMFFPLFLAMKKKYINDNQAKKHKKESKIKEILTKLSSDKKKILKSLLSDEKSVNVKVTLWRNYFLPKSQKLAKNMVNNNNIEVSTIIDKFIIEFNNKYKKDIYNKYKSIIAKFILEIDINAEQTNETLQKQYRALSKKYHPDTGGSQQKFEILKNSYDFLLKNNATIH